MTDLSYTALVLCVDHSGSMGKVRDDAQGAVNHIVNAQKDLPGRCDVMLCEFNTTWNLVYSLRPVQDTPSYFMTPMGGTALLDAIGFTINELGAQLDALPENDRPGTVIVAIQTDGEENSSVTHSLAEISAMISHQQNVYQWQFLFLGADLDAITIGAGMNIRAGQTMSYGNDAQGTRSMVEAVKGYIASARSGQTPDELGSQRP